MDTRNKAQQGLSILKDAIVDYLAGHPEGRTNAQIYHDLDLHSDQNGKQKNYLSWSVLGLLMRDGRVERVEKLYFKK